MTDIFKRNTSSYMLSPGDFIWWRGILTLSRAPIIGHLPAHVDLWHSKHRSPIINPHLCSVVHPEAQGHDNKSLPVSSINRQSPKQPINIPPSTWPWPPDRRVLTEVKGGPMVALSVRLPWPWYVLLPSVSDREVLCSCHACWCSVAKLMSFWKQLIKGSRSGQRAISLHGDSGCLLLRLAGGLRRATELFPPMMNGPFWVKWSPLNLIFLAMLAVWLRWRQTSVDFHVVKKLMAAYRWCLALAVNLPLLMIGFRKFDWELLLWISVQRPVFPRGLTYKTLDIRFTIAPSECWKLSL